ncbi:MAG: hypothetical protein A2V99_03590, partial [Spirochaetes bacterium RBG_16_67_19]
MKRTRGNRAGLITAALLLLALPAFESAGLELSTRFDLGNLGFDPDRTSADATYSGADYYWGGAVEVTHGFSEKMAIRAGFSRETVLRNLAYAMVYYNLDYLSMGIGTIQGFNNTGGSVLKPGLASSVQLTFPGVMFARLLFDTSLGGVLMETGDYSQNRNELSVGFYVPNAICTLSLQSSKFFELRSDTLDVVDSLMRYSFEADIFQKNAPYRLLFSLAYQVLQKKFIDDLVSPDPVHTLSSLMAGVQLSIDLTRYLTIMLGADSALLTIGDGLLSGLQNPAPGGYLFTAW